MSAEPDYGKKALLAFADMLASKGLASTNTARGYKVAAAKIIDDEVTDVRTVEIPLAVKRYHNKNPGRLSPATLGEYENRVGSLIREFVKFHDDPQAYAGIGRGTPTNPSKERSKKAPAPISSPEPAAESSMPPKTAPSASRGGLSLEFPLRADFLAQVIVPRDMKAEEARRLCAFVKTLAIDFSPEDP